MCAYYMLFGLFSVDCAGRQPAAAGGHSVDAAGHAHAARHGGHGAGLGMAIDSNVLINERVREELRNGASPQAAIHAGYDRAWARFSTPT
jgi:preprotein translocase subunit SecD